MDQINPLPPLVRMENCTTTTSTLSADLVDVFLCTLLQHGLLNFKRKLSTDKGKLTTINTSTVFTSTCQINLFVLFIFLTIVRLVTDFKSEQSIK